MSSFGFLLYVKVYERPGISAKINKLLLIQTHTHSVIV